MFTSANTPFSLRVLSAVFALQISSFSFPAQAATPQEELALMGVSFDQDSFTLYAGRGDYKVVMLFLQGGMSPNLVESKFGSPPIVYASAQGYQKVVDALVTHGADVNLPNNDGYTALIAAAHYGHQDIVEYLLNHSALIDHMPRLGPTALIAAIQEGQLGIAELLLHRGASPSLADTAGATPLIAAAYSGRTKLIDALIGMGVDVNHSNSLGDTALHASARNNHVTAVRRLLEAGADTMIKNADGVTPFAIAQLKHYKEIEALDKGAHGKLAGTNPTLAKSLTASGGEPKNNAQSSQQIK